MKTYKDLEWDVHKYWPSVKIARHNFDNGYGVSVLKGVGTVFGGPYTNSPDEHELAVLYDNKITYESDITDDVIGYLSKADVEELISLVQSLPRPQHTTKLSDRFEPHVVEGLLAGDKPND